MKHKINMFIKLRKQSDIMKIVCILVIIGICFFASLIYYVADIYHYVNMPAEYVLSTDEKVSDKRINELVQLDNGVTVSKQKQIPVTIEYNGFEMTVDCLVLSKEYAKETFGIDTIDGTKRFYLDEESLSDLKQQLEDINEGDLDFKMENSVQGMGGVELDIKYMDESGEMADMSDGDGDSGDYRPQKYKKGKLSVIKRKEWMSKIIFTVGDSKDFLNDICGLRVNFKNHDLDGGHEEKLRKLGYSFENENIVIEDKNELEIKLIHIKYGIICFILCFISVGVMIHLLPLTKEMELL